MLEQSSIVQRLKTRYHAGKANVKGGYNAAKNEGIVQGVRTWVNGIGPANRALIKGGR